MTAQELWDVFEKLNPEINADFDAWQFGVEADTLAQLVIDGVKTATSSAYDLYEIDKEPIPKEGSYHIILNSRDEAVCLIKIIKVSFSPFNQVTQEHAFKEGEGDRTLDYWKQAHINFFTSLFEEYGLHFTTDKQVVLEEFEVIYPKKETLI